MNNITNPAGGSALGNNPGAMGASNAGQHNDMGDKAFDAGAKKFGHVNPDTAEKITDGARGAFEKATGKKVSSKISN
ncbi:uncharacterized protein B0T15DRAFT_494314 [Chaetomium strumarium]|uniref:Uncharacterized protein n=1 Tax=Chaetomium strumarium TaxID=1170767 RepID=A0AAJ0GU67_9PEZI|nr:hypothetical protein B0T15DRAFT_494314 [Chaetomium strumarium]